MRLTRSPEPWLLQKRPRFQTHLHSGLFVEACGPLKSSREHTGPRAQSVHRKGGKGAPSRPSPAPTLTVSDADPHGWGPQGPSGCGSLCPHTPTLKAAGSPGPKPQGPRRPPRGQPPSWDGGHKATPSGARTSVHRGSQHPCCSQGTCRLLGVWGERKPPAAPAALPDTVTGPDLGRALRAASHWFASAGMGAQSHCHPPASLSLARVAGQARAGGPGTLPPVSGGHGPPPLKTWPVAQPPAAPSLVPSHLDPHPNSSSRRPRARSCSCSVS